MRKKETLRTSELDATIVLSSDEKTRESILTELEKEQINAPEFSERYKFICKFAAGGVGEISKAKDVVFDRIVAVKKLNDRIKSDPSSINSFIHESRLNAQLDHPSIVPVYAMGRGKEGEWECVMKFINGSSLYHFINKIRETYDSKKISQAQEHHALVSRLEYFVKICEAVEYCHSMKVVHGDIKPDNILMGKFGEVFLMDWGCARELGSKPDRISGTPNYLPPEYLKERVVTAQIDIFSLGMLLFEMATLRPGKQVCTGKQSGDCSCRVVFDLKNYIHYVPKLKINDRIKAIIYKALNPDPKKRYQSVKALNLDVRHFIHDEEVSAAPDNLLRKMFRFFYHNRMKTLIVAIAVFSIFCGALFYAYYRSNAHEKQHTEDLMRRLRLQSYTDILSNAVEKKLLLCQAQLQLFADNLMEDMQESKDTVSQFYSPKDFLNPKTAPPGMIRTHFYPNPINLQYMVRKVPPQLKGQQLDLLGAKQYVTLCKKVLSYDLETHYINIAKDSADILLSENCLVQRLMVRWANGVRYSYPGSYDNPVNPAYAFRWEKNKDNPDKRLFWSPPYQGVTGTYRISCQYPMYLKSGKYLGTAAIELRLEKLLAPLLRANFADPVHELYLITKNGEVISLENGELETIDEKYSGRDHISLNEVKILLKRLKANHMEQIELKIKGEPYYISVAKLPTFEGVLLQMISVRAMKNHNHVVAF